MRIDKLLSQLKYGSRTEVKEMIKDKRIMINGLICTNAGSNVDPNHDHISVDQEIIFYKDSIDLMIYKPKGYLSAHHDIVHPCIMELINPPYNRFDFSMAGRLDLDAEGLMILSTDGMFTHQITHPKYHLKKVYEVELDQSFTKPNHMLNGLWIKDGKNEPYFAKALEISYEEKYVTLTIDEGKFHQVKRMFEALGYLVVSLKRISIGNLNLKNLKPGEYQTFERNELYD